MDNTTALILESVLGDEFKIAVDKKDRILQKLDDEITLKQKTIADLEGKISDLNKQSNGLQDAIIIAYHDKDEALKKAQDNFEISKVNSTKSLEDREKGLEDREAKHEIKVKAHEDNVVSFSKEKVSFNNRKNAIAETLTEAFNAHSSLLKDAIDAINEPYDGEIKEEAQQTVD